ncbi:MAG: GNAT family N-acetyltransferase [Chloroflexi bacterium]|nr:MAG: GNAT family N-acetyltransferase [Chloroflexota bacterium]MBL1193053.1 GNAT family N-acetyltransferase [Chloroflexota bacterium]NOH10346.1 GNAT family N-acetyltransferase [Chloroflexota bacterium]
MTLLGYTSPKDFLATTEKELEKQEVVNSLVLGIARRLAGGHSFNDNPPYFAAVMDGSGLISAAFMTPPYGLVLAAIGSEDVTPALQLIAEDLYDNGWPVPDVNGPNPTSEIFARIWTQITGSKSKLAIPQLLYELRKVTLSNQRAVGQLRLADANEGDLLAEWLLAFEQDAFGRQMRSAEAAFAFIEKSIQVENVYVWHDGAPVSMLMRSRPTRHGITVNMVYTPPELRRRGYASASVAALSQLLLDEGFEFCTLFTDAANPTSNKIYTQIGYQLVCKFDKYSFE